MRNVFDLKERGLYVGTVWRRELGWEDRELRLHCATASLATFTGTMMR
jgi:hypothetical protein